MDNQGFQKPKDAQTAPKPNTLEPVVHVMPKEYRGGAAATIRKSQPPAPVQVRVEQPKPKPVPTPAVGASANVAAKQPLKPHHSALFFIAIVVGILLLAIALGIGYVVYQQNQQTPTPAPQTPVVVTPPITPPMTPPVTTPVPPQTAPVTGGIDSDADGLSDVEELRLYTTLVFNPDSDNDSFLDGNEVFHLYDPTKPNFVRLAESSIVKSYLDPAGEYSLYVPVSFMSTPGSDASQVNWSIPSGENITITRYPKPDQEQTVQAWFAIQFPDRAGELMLPYATKTGITGMQTQTRMETYLGGQGSVYKVEYLLGGAPSIEYRRTYEMMLNSFMYGV